MKGERVYLYIKKISTGQSTKKPPTDWFTLYSRFLLFEGGAGGPYIILPFLYPV